MLRVRPLRKLRAGRLLSASLVTTYGFDSNQNPILITRPLGNTIEFDYDERDLKIAIRVGGPTGSVTIMVYDGNRNLPDVIGPAIRGTAAQTLSCVIADAFGGGTNITFTGDWLVQNNYDGFDRIVPPLIPLGGMALNTFDPGGRPSPPVLRHPRRSYAHRPRRLAQPVCSPAPKPRFDEAGRQYETQRDVFLDAALLHRRGQ